MRQLPGLVHRPTTRKEKEREREREEERDIVQFNYRAFVGGNKVSEKEMVDAEEQIASLKSKMNAKKMICLYLYTTSKREKCLIKSVLHKIYFFFLF